MRVLLSTYPSRAKVSPMVRFAVQLGTLGASEKFDGAPATGLMPSEVW